MQRNRFPTVLAAAVVLVGASCRSGGDGTIADPSPLLIGDELGRYTTEQGLTRIYIPVDPDITDDELVDLARELHETDREIATFFFIDDDSRMDDVFAALPETEQGDQSNWPADWVVEHTVAELTMLVGFPDPTTRRWVLDRGLDPDPENALAVFA